MPQIYPLAEKTASSLPISARHLVFIYPQIKKLTGAQRLILSLAGALSSFPADPPCGVTLLTHRFAPECRPALPDSLELIESKTNLNLFGNHYLDSLLEYLAVPFLLKRLPRETTAICFFGPPSLPGLWWARFIRRLKIPLLYFCYEPPRAAYSDRKEVSRRMGRPGKLVQILFLAYRPLDRYLARRADRVLVNSEFGRDLIRQTYQLPSTVITHGVDLASPENLEQAVENLKERFKLKGKNVILTVNHLHPRKRLDLLLEALPLILKEHPAAVILIIGKGPEEQALKALRDKLGLDPAQVIFAGFVSDPELASCYALADIYAHTCRVESFGLSVLEGSGSGLPVVAVDEGGPREIIEDGKSGFLVPAHPQEIASKINFLLENPEIARTMGLYGSRRVNELYTWRRGAEDFLEALGKKD